MNARDLFRRLKALAQPRLGNPRFAGTPSFRLARKVAVTVIGSTVLAFGVACVVLPAPAILVIPFGLAILATEFLWARRLLGPIRGLLDQLRARARRTLGRPSQPVATKALP